MQDERFAHPISFGALTIEKNDLSTRIYDAILGKELRGNFKQTGDLSHGKEAVAKLAYKLSVVHVFDCDEDDPPVEDLIELPVLEEADLVELAESILLREVFVEYRRYENRLNNEVRLFCAETGREIIGFLPGLKFEIGKFNQLTVTVKFERAIEKIILKKGQLDFFEPEKPEDEPRSDLN